jgi:lipopolysaccharide/colanic/teichoic acid biosynthesis glycosyltransferase
MIRLFDVSFSILALITLSPILIIVSILLKFTGEGEIFFLQQRVGMNGRMFKLYKFATMLKNSPNMGTGTVTMKDDTRILPLGKFLRKSKINELPQLFNILIGDMSIIGPRPQAKSCFDAFSTEAQKNIIKLKPGLSGIGPIIFRNEENILEGNSGTLDFYNNAIAPYKGEVEAWYLDNRNVPKYFMLISMTVWVVVFSKSDLVWKLFDDLPIPPDILKKDLNYPN